MDRVNKEMLILARDLRALSQADLAQLVGLNQATISRYENGADVPDEHLAAIAKALDRPKSFFFWGESLYDASCMYHRRNRQISVAELTAIHAKVNMLRIVASRLLKMAQVKSSYSFFRLDASKLGGPIGCARELRRLWQLPIGPVRSVVRAIENAGGMVFRCQFGETRVDGISQWPLDAPGMPPIFFVNEKAPGDRERWTLCHEIGHIVMHHSPSSDDPEEEANVFASEFLMPQDEIQNDLLNMTLAKAAALKSKWKTSMQSIIYRAHQLGKIPDRQYQSLFRQMGYKGYRSCEPVPIVPEEPEMFRELLDFHRERVRLGPEQLAEFIGETRKEAINQYGNNFANFRLVG